MRINRTIASVSTATQAIAGESRNGAAGHSVWSVGASETNQFLEESERYIRLAYMLGLVKAGQHAERPAKETPARDHAEWIEMRRRRKR